MISVAPASRAAVTKPAALVSPVARERRMSSAIRPGLTTRSPGERARLVASRSATGPASAFVKESAPKLTLLP